MKGSMNTRFGLVACCALGLVGCGPQSPSSPPSSTAEAPPAVQRRTASAEKTSFAEVTALLDPGGSIYGYLSTAHWFEGLSRRLEPWRDLILSLPDVEADDQEGIRRVADVLGSLVRQSGIESVSGVGFSGLAVEPGYYRSKLVVHHYAGQGQGYLWSLLGTEAHALELPDWLPTNTVWAASLDLDLAGVWKAVREHVRQAGIPDMIAGLDELEQQVEQATGMKLEDLLGSLGGQFGLALTLDPNKLIPIPLPEGEALQVPEPGLVLAVKVRDDRLFDWAGRLLAENPQVVEGNQPDLGLRMRTLALPLPLPMEVRPSLARAGDYLWVTSHDQLMQRLAQVKAGRLAGLRTTAEFKRLTDGLPAQGNQFAFVSDQLQEILRLVQRAALASSRQSGGPPEALMTRLFALGGRVAMASVGAVGPEGWISVSHGHQQPADAIALPVMVAPVAVMAGITMPALAKAKNRAQSISCVNNLKQMGLAAHIYSTDHADQFPPEILSMKAELSNPRVLICPESPQASKAKDLTWESLRPEDISYEYLGAGKKSDGINPQDPMFRCRVHGHVCRMDGSVQQASR